MIYDLKKVKVVNLDDVGGKGYNLHKLIHAGLPVPNTVAIHPNYQSNKILDHLSQIDFIARSKHLAVRSSGVGEDSQSESWAGIFDSYLFVEYDNLDHHIKLVKDSLQSTKYQVYSQSKQTALKNMAIIVQEMIDADFAGVAFTVNPIERDARSILIEIVSGVGESLVSGKITPVSVRLNKLTGMRRIQYRGKENISNTRIDEICDLLVPYIEQIEAIYDIPVDIEWAIKDNQVYVLQARPITTT